MMVHDSTWHVLTIPVLASAPDTEAAAAVATPPPAVLGADNFVAQGFRLLFLLYLKGLQPLA